MGLLNLLRKLKKTNNEARVLVLGLDNAGKTTILKKMSDEDPANIAPTQGFNIKSLSVDEFKLNVWDIGGQASIRPYWRNYFDNTDALVYVVDAADTRRGSESAQELQQLLNECKLAGVPLLVFANKMDLGNSMEEDEVSEILMMNDISDREWHLLGCSAKTGDNLQEGLEWLVEKVNEAEELSESKGNRM